MKGKIRIGDTVMWRGCFGMERAKKAKVVSIQLCAYEGDKYGDDVDEIDWKDIRRSVFDLDNGHWCYGDQITRKCI